MKFLGQVFSVILMQVYQMFIYGFVFMKLYNWFIPKIFNIGEISLVLSMGLLTFISFATYVYRKDINEDKSFTYKVIFAFIMTTFVGTLFLLLGYFIHLFV